MQQLIEISDKKFEQYKLEVETADRTTGRRYTFNNFMLVFSTAISTGLLHALNDNSRCLVTLLGGIGFLICLLWGKQIENFKSILKIKYDIIKSIENQYSNDLINISNQEYSIRNENEKQNKFVQFSTVEIFIVHVFIIFYVLTIVLYWANRI